MFTRFFYAKFKTGRLAAFKSFYNEEVLPVLQRTEACFYACLIQSVEDSNEFVSCTLWDTQAHAQALERSDTYHLLLEKAREMLVGSTEWKVQLTKELKLEYAPVYEDPVVRSYRAMMGPEPYHLSQATQGPMYVRLTSIKVEPEKLSEFKQIYESEILPELRGVSGCRYAFLVDSPEEKEVMSVTIWDSKEHADAYEKSGMFQRLVEKVRHTFSQVYQWKMKLAEEVLTDTVTSEDVIVRPYQIVVGKQLR